ncbi:MAG: amidohydrolase family protein [Desulfobacterales bacterium]|jgi:predicted TIM-barrel fold metal-dependent hydrolase|nr:amidohydrolase family protein [Desulfobacterales bacterium]
MKYYDAHVHIHTLSMNILDGLYEIQRNDIMGFVALIYPDYPNDLSIVQKMFPSFFHDHISHENFATEKEFLPLAAKVTNLEILPYIDTRFVETDADATIKKYREAGWKGLKIIYVPEECPVLNIGGMAQAFGRSMKASEKHVSSQIETASKLGMPVLLHADLRRYADFAAEQIETYPGTNFNIAHFGFSRREITRFLDNYPNCYSDSSSLTPYFKKEPKNYRDFISHYQDKVLFGSDALFCYPGTLLTEKNAMLDLVEEPEVRKKIFVENYRRFHHHDSC